MNREEAIKLGTKMMLAGSSSAEAASEIIKKGGVKSRHSGKMLNVHSIRVILGEAAKRKPVKTQVETLEAMQEQLYRTRIASAFVDLKIAFLRTEKTTFTYDEITATIDKVGSQII